MENNKQTDLTIKQKDGLAIIIKQKPKRYQVTEKQLQAILQKRIESKLTESLSFNTDEEKRAFIKVGNIITFKDPLPGFPRGQIAVAKIKRDKSGAIKLINPFGTESPWYQSEKDLMDAIDWQWISKNIITKEYE
jgi:hypothetical protein